LINGVRVPGGTLLDEEVMARFDSSPNAYKMKTEVKFKSSCCGAQMIREVYNGKGKRKRQLIFVFTIAENAAKDACIKTIIKLKKC